MELYPTALSRAELRKEQLYQEMCKKKEKGEKFDAEKNKYFKKMKAYAEEHNGSPLLFSITIIGIPFGKMHFRLAKLALSPLGKRLYSP